MNTALTKPDWDHLYLTAEAQAGYFTTAQAKASGYSAPLLNKHVAAGRFRRIRRGIYRLVHFPAMENEEFVIVWLWSDGTGVLSHETALSLYGLSDVLPDSACLTLPERWRRRRVQLPDGVRVHYADLLPTDRGWFGYVPITTPTRTLRDCLAAHVSPDLMTQAIEQAADRGIVAPDVLDELRTSLRDSLRVAG